MNHGQRPWYWEGPPAPEGAIREVAPVGGVELERSRFLPGTDRGFSVDDEFQAHPMSCESLAKRRPEWEKHAGSLEALRVTRPEAVDLAGNKLSDLGRASRGQTLWRGVVQNVSR